MTDDEIELGLRILWLCHCYDWGEYSRGEGRIEFERKVAGHVARVCVLLFTYFSITISCYHISRHDSGLSGFTATIHVYIDTHTHSIWTQYTGYHSPTFPFFHLECAREIFLRQFTSHCDCASDQRCFLQPSQGQRCHRCPVDPWLHSTMMDWFCDA